MIRCLSAFGFALIIFSSVPAQAQKTAKKPAAKREAPPALKFPPTVPNGERVVTDKSEAFLKPTD